MRLQGMFVHLDHKLTLIKVLKRELEGIISFIGDSNNHRLIYEEIYRYREIEIEIDSDRDRDRDIEIVIEIYR